MSTVLTPDFVEVPTEALARLAQSGDADALTALLDRFRPLARAVAGQRASAGLPADDAESMCIETFVRTLPGFDPSLGTLAAYWTSRAHMAIIDHFRHVTGTGRRNGGLAAAFRAEIDEALSRRGNDFVDLTDFAARHGVSRCRAYRVAAAYGGMLSLSTPAGKFSQPIEQVFMGEDPSPAVEAERISNTEFIRANLQRLPEPERTVVEMYFGLNDRPAVGFMEIGSHLGFSRQRAHQIMRDAIRRLRKRLAEIN